MNKIGKWLLVTTVLAIYLNIGWAFGTWFRENVHLANPADFGFWQTVFAGPNEFFAGFVETIRERAQSVPVWTMKIAGSVLWSVAILVLLVAWVGWLVFAGGLYAALGPTTFWGLVAIAIIIGLFRRYYNWMT